MENEKRFFPQIKFPVIDKDGFPIDEKGSKKGNEIPKNIGKVNDAVNITIDDSNVENSGLIKVKRT